VVQQLAEGVVLSLLIVKLRLHPELAVAVDKHELIPRLEGIDVDTLAVGERDGTGI
jgi:hypothetical protein